MGSSILLLSTALIIAAGPAPVKRAADAKNADDLAQKIVQFCKDQTGKKVQTGECAELAVVALKFAHARRYPPFGGTTADYVWGTLVATVKKGNPFPTGVIRPGDILQLRDARFPRTRTIAHHTAVVVSVRDGGRAVTVRHQGASRNVQADDYQLGKLEGGWVKAYRPVPLPPPDLRKFAEADPYVEEVLKLFNAARAKAGREPLTLRIPLRAASSAMAQRLAKGENPGEEALIDAVQTSGYAEKTMRGIHVQTTASPAELVKLLMDVPAGKECVLSPEFTEFGLATHRPQPNQEFIYLLFASPELLPPSTKGIK